MAMAKLFILFALCVLPAVVLANRPLPVAYEVHGGVYCDTCGLGCQHDLSTVISGAKVKVQCKDSETESIVYEREGVTGADGKYTIPVRDDHEEEICDVVLVSSPQNDCKEIVPGLDRARVIVTNNNGINSYKRFANNLGFRKASNVAGCGKLAQLFASEDV